MGLYTGSTGNSPDPDLDDLMNINDQMSTTYTDNLIEAQMIVVEVRKLKWFKICEKLLQMYVVPFLSQKLACLLYKAADEDGDVDPFLVSRILGVTKDDARRLRDNNQNCGLQLPRPNWRRSVNSNGVIPGQAHRILYGM